MTSYPPPYAPDESKGMYPPVDVQQQQPLQPAGYPPPGGQAAVTYYPQGPTPQQPQQLVIAQPAPVIVQAPQHVQSFVWHIVFSCCVTWCCFCPCGFLAFILAMCGHCQASSSPSSARQLGTASIVFSVLGIILPVVAFVIVAVFYGLAAIPQLINVLQGNCYEKNDHCYRWKSMLSEEQCAQVTSHLSQHYYDGTYCYHD